MSSDKLLFPVGTYDLIEDGIGNLGVAAMKAGYAGSQDIIFDVSSQKEEFFKTNKETLENFLDFLLNEDGCSDIPFSVDLKWNVIKKQRTQSSVRRNNCLALSGGLDSMASYLRLKTKGEESICCMFLNYQQEQLDFETRSFLDTILEFQINPYVVESIVFSDEEKNADHGWPFGGFKIPARNFTILAMMNKFLDLKSRESHSLNYGVYAGEIMDKNRDKSRRFFDEATEIFSNYNGVETIVKSPVGDMSKIEQLQFLDSVGHLDFALSTARTCVAPTEDPCMNCKPCFNRMLSVYFAGFKDRVPADQWTKLAESDIADEYSQHINDYTGVRKSDIESFLAFLADGTFNDSRG